MFCKNCGKKNPENSNFCEHCGIKLIKTHNEEVVEKSETKAVENEEHTNSKVIDSETPPFPYVISIPKLVILSILTLGVFEIYWFYKQWKSFSGKKHNIFALIFISIFAGFSSFSLFPKIAEEVKSTDSNRKLNAGPLALTFLVLNALWKLPDPYWLISGLSVLPIIPVQNAINYLWERKLGDKLAKSSFGLWNYVWAIGGGIVLLLVTYTTLFPEDTTSLLNETPVQEASSVTQNKTVNNDVAEKSRANLESIYEKNFMANCNETGDQYDSCYCLLEYLRSNYTMDERVKMDEDYNRTGVEPQAIYDAASACS